MIPQTPSLTVDIIILYHNQIVLIKRKNQPYQNCYAFPGGFVEIGETVEQAAVREAKEETGLDVTLVKLLDVYSDPRRDPRGHTVSITYLAKGTGELKAATDAKEASTFAPWEAPDNLAFDHSKMLQDAKKYIKLPKN
ncbi:MAG: NUDIX domain-containing protein [Methanosarcinales archaeon]|uniref:NUDIX domain-containing protein n=1 Tax=Candidatus Ethanoperedens thermophilum TaxID=2766897 RepID=A0A848DAC0_9EURY|nr:NUDIX domain-containing protein [Candidatus Ethanoperedens thermophilum]